jgi:hypothetical protein
MTGKRAKSYQPEGFAPVERILAMRRAVKFSNGLTDEMKEEIDKALYGLMLLQQHLQPKRRSRPATLTTRYAYAIRSLLRRYVISQEGALHGLAELCSKMRGQRHITYTALKTAYREVRTSKWTKDAQLVPGEYPRIHPEFQRHVDKVADGIAAKLKLTPRKMPR